MSTLFSSKNQFLVGVVLSATSNMLGTLSWGIRQSSEAENNFTSVERIIDYANLPPEGEGGEITKKVVFNRNESKACINRILSPSSSANHQIYQGGSVKFDQVSFNYYKGGRIVLNNISFDVRPGEKIGVVGRTGAGKSSIIAALFRINPIESGKILINGVDTSNGSPQ